MRRLDHSCCWVSFTVDVTLKCDVVPTGGCPGSSHNLPTLAETCPEQNPPPQAPAPSEHGPKPSAASVKEVGSGNSAPKPPPSQVQAHLHYKPSEQRASPSLCLGKRAGVHQQGAKRPASEGRNPPFLVQEAPVRDEMGTCWSSTSSDSDAGFRFSRSSRRKEPAMSFPASAGGAEEFGRLSPDFSDVTVYNEIAQKTPHAQKKAVSCREPTPGSEAERGQEVCPRPLFSELRQHQQDSGFGSPFYQK